MIVTMFGVTRQNARKIIAQFGRYARATTPGFYTKMPWPFETIAGRCKPAMPADLAGCQRAMQRLTAALIALRPVLATTACPLPSTGEGASILRI